MSLVRAAALLALLTASSVAPAQSFTDWMLVDGSGLQRFSNGVVTTIGFPQADGLAMMDADNRHYIGYGFAAGLMRFDPNTQVITTLTTVAPTQIGVDQNGDYLLARQNRIDVLGRASLQLTTLAQSTLIGTPYGMTTDIDTGDVVIESWNGRLTLTRVSNGVVTSIYQQISTSIQTGGSVVQDASDGSFLAVHYLFSRTTRRVDLLKVQGGTLVSSLQASTGAMGGLVALDRVAEGKAVVPAGPGLEQIDLGPFAVTSQIPMTSGFLNALFPDRHRNLASVRTANRQWQLAMSFPGEAGRGYALAVGVSGVRGGVPLADGRVIQLALDPIAIASLSGALAPLVQNNVGTLGATGTAVATLDLSPLPPALSLRVWAIAVTIDPNAPVPIATIADPIGIDA